MGSPEPAAFLSYVRADDQHEGGLISQFRERLSAEVRMRRGSAGRFTLLWVWVCTEEAGPQRAAPGQWQLIGWGRRACEYSLYRVEGESGRAHRGDSGAF